MDYHIKNDVEIQILKTIEEDSKELAKIIDNNVNINIIMEIILQKMTKYREMGKSLEVESQRITELFAQGLQRQLIPFNIIKSILYNRYKRNLESLATTKEKLEAIKTLFEVVISNINAKNSDDIIKHASKEIFLSDIRDCFLASFSKEMLINDNLAIEEFTRKYNIDLGIEENIKKIKL